MMRPEVLQAVFIPFAGTVLGSACVFFLRGEMPRFVQRGACPQEYRLPPA